MRQGNTLWHAVMGTLPAAEVMGVVGALALLVNGGVAFVLYRYRGGDSNMRSVWICSRNDALGNVAVMLAALGVFGTGTGWPDIIVASVMAALSLWGAGQIINHAWNELRTGEGKMLSSGSTLTEATVKIRRPRGRAAIDQFMAKVEPQGQALATTIEHENEQKGCPRPSRPCTDRFVPTG
jgi:Co/Zn/Cd efflux system component